MTTPTTTSALPERPFLFTESKQRNHLANAIINHFMVPGESANGLVYYLDHYYQWTGTRWKRRSAEWLSEEVTRILNRYVFRITNDPSGAQNHIEPTISKVRDICYTIKAEVSITDRGTFPMWLGDPHTPLPNPSNVLVFDNAIIDLAATAARFRETGTYDWVILPRTWRWFGTPQIPLDFDPDAQAPLWERTIHEWQDSDNDDWSELLERSFGAAISPARHWAKFLVLYGTSRAGKGTSTTILSHLVPDTTTSTPVNNLLADRQSATGHHADVTLINEIGDLDKQQANALAEHIRLFMGRDRTEINQKYGAIHTNVRYHNFPILQTHNILRLPNEQGGITSKMLALRFTRTFRDNPNFNLESSLLAELPGIATRLARALIRLWAADPPDRWPMSQSSRMLTRDIESESNPIDAFLNWGFTRAPSTDKNAWVHIEQIYTTREQYENNFDMPLRRRNGTVVPPRKLLSDICKYSSWGLSIERRAIKSQEGTSNPTGIRGLRWKNPGDRD